MAQAAGHVLPCSCAVILDMLQLWCTGCTAPQHQHAHAAPGAVSRTNAPGRLAVLEADRWVCLLPCTLAEGAPLLALQRHLLVPLRRSAALQPRLVGWVSFLFVHVCQTINMLHKIGRQQGPRCSGAATLQLPSFVCQGRGATPGDRVGLLVVTIGHVRKACGACARRRVGCL
jgi:hypothetical protein